ncbi:hypothetical protein FGO68_gene17718 [Halteria grandinella]|uniref:Tubulin-tyrosine ligase family protein n=1 Tax=Halteria grandinella TaxID=5974 RepID=A0A8J8T9H8_HALGN|nr:hypothetical protein FGO68_gene17718 [Halteria grandinella]
MKRFYESIGRDAFEVIPLTFHIRHGCKQDDHEYMEFLKKFNELENFKQSFEDQFSANHKQKQRQKSKYLHHMQNEDLRVIQIPQMERNQTRKPFNKGEFFSPRESDKFSRLDLDQGILMDRSPFSSRRHNETTTVNKSKELFVVHEKNIAINNFGNAPDGVTTMTKFPSITTSKQANQNRTRFKSNYKKEESRANLSSVSTALTAEQQHFQNIWIVKPGENTNRGNGITVCSSFQEIKQIFNENNFDDYQAKTFIVQKYIENPQLYKGRKFDIRCYAMLTSVNGLLKGYFYDPDQSIHREGGGYIRTSSREYNLSKNKLQNKLIHLTNDAIQKRADDYGKHEIGNKISFKEYQQYLNDTNRGIDFLRDIFSSQIKRIITDTFRATANLVDPNKRCHSFEIFGYDFMLDSNFQVYLIEVNTNPCIETSQCPILQRVITDMLDSGFRIAVDPLFPPPNFQKRTSLNLPLTNWELIFDSEIDCQL